MKAAGYIGLAVLMAARVQAEPLAPMAEPPLPEAVTLSFSSDGIDLGQQVADFIGAARKEVLVSAYALTEQRVLRQLVAAFDRDLVVGVLLDPSPAVRNYQTPRVLRSHGLPVILANRGLRGDGWHNQKFIVIDRQAVLVPSFDFTSAATQNTESLLIFDDPTIAARYYNAWLREATSGTPMR